MAKRLTSSDIYDINKKTGALILGKNRLDDYATKFLTKFCKEALIKPMPLPVDDILKNANLTVKEAKLSKNLDIFGCCLLLDGYVDIYNTDSNDSLSTFFPAGTILIDPNSEAVYGEGARRNTLIHEALHWEKDKTYFEILSLKNFEDAEELSPILCRQSETFFEPPEGKKTKANEVKWLEWQAHRLAPRVLMPYNSFKKKALDIIDTLNSKGNNIISCDELIEILSKFFIVSRVSVKYRLIEVGLLDTISKFKDYNAVYAEINTDKEFVKISPVEAYKLLSNNSSLREWVYNGKFIFADGYFVIASPKYIMSDNGCLKLTPKAKKTLAQCVLNIHEHSFTEYINYNKDFVGYSVLYRATDTIDRRMLTFHPKYQTNFKYEPEEIYEAFSEELLQYDEKEEIELMKKLGDPTCSLCQCLWFLMENRNWKYPEVFYENTNLHKNYHGKIKNDKYNNMGTDVLMAICVGLKLNLRITEKIFQKSDNKLNYYQDPDRTYIRILENMPGISMQDFNSICQQSGIKELGSSLKI